MTRRKISDEERALFEQSFKEAIPLAPIKTPKLGTARKSKSAKHTGLDGNTSDRLRRGELEPQARLDLHGMTELAGHRALVNFIRGAYRRGLRLVIVVTGKGGKPRPDDAPFDLELETRRRGVHKTMAPRWLAEPELARLIADVRNAHRSHGGEGALYVYLRKSEP
jgi:DNA-nicking Smr family endonuclease